jgi:hypothetical protein
MSTGKSSSSGVWRDDQNIGGKSRKRNESSEDESDDETEYDSDDEMFSHSLENDWKDNSKANREHKSRRISGKAERQEESGRISRNDPLPEKTLSRTPPPRIYPETPNLHLPKSSLNREDERKDTVPVLKKKGALVRTNRITKPPPTSHLQRSSSSTTTTSTVVAPPFKPVLTKKKTLHRTTRMDEETKKTLWPKVVSSTTSGRHDKPVPDNVFIRPAKRPPRCPSCRAPVKRTPIFFTVNPNLYKHRPLRHYQKFGPMLIPFTCPCIMMNFEIQYLKYIFSDEYLNGDFIQMAIPYFKYERAYSKDEIMDIADYVIRFAICFQNDDYPTLDNISTAQKLVQIIWDHVKKSELFPIKYKTITIPELIQKGKTKHAEMIKIEKDKMEKIEKDKISRAKDKIYRAKKAAKDTQIVNSFKFIQANELDDLRNKSVKIRKENAPTRKAQDKKLSREETLVGWRKYHE